MATYVQIGKNPRMLINDKVENIRKDFIKQIPTLGWKKLVPIYFYSTANGKDCKGILLPTKWKSTFSDTKEYYRFYWITAYDYWTVDGDNRKRKVDFETVGWDWMMAVFKKYREAGYKIYD